MSSAVRLQCSVPYVSTKRETQEFALQLDLQVVRDVVGGSASLLRPIRLHKENTDFSFTAELAICLRA